MIASQKRHILGENLPNRSIIILVGQREVLRNGDVSYPFRQDSDILLLTGLDVPDIVLLGEKHDGPTRYRLYSDDISESEKLWGTSRLDPEKLSEISGIVDIFPLRQWRDDMSAMMMRNDSIFVRNKTHEDYESRFLLSQDIIFPGEKIQSLDPFLRELRLIKLPEEIENIRQAIAITQVAYEKIRTVIEPKMYEYEVESHIAQVFRAHHTIEAYPTIVASGSNACTLHYTGHTDILDADDLLLIDFGAEYRGYAADITRVFSLAPMNPRQKEIYNAVVGVKTYAESQIRPGVKKSDYELAVRENMDRALERLGLIPPGIPREERAKLSRKYYPHSLSHFLGLDVHDPGSRDEAFRSGMVITCEPGIYIRDEGIGIRLEDDILITDTGCENLSREIPL